MYTTDRTADVIKNRRKRLKSRYLLWSCIGVAAALILHSSLSFSESKSARMEKLFPSHECSTQVTWMKKGGVFLYFCCICYLFLGISMICDGYFLDSLKIISDRLNLSDDICGATFMAAGSSAPELFTSLVALIYDKASNDIGVGTIVGSAVFNILVIIGVSAVSFAGKLTLDYRPVARDCIFYAFAIGGIAVVFHDGKVYWWEGLISVFLYGVYILALKFNKQLMLIFPIPESRKSKYECFNGDDIDIDTQYEALSGLPSLSSPSADVDSGNNYVAPPVLPATSGEIPEEHSNVRVHIEEYRDSSMHDEIRIESGSHGDANGPIHHVNYMEAPYRISFSIPETSTEKVFWLVSLPWMLAFHYTVPDLSKAYWKNWYIVTFIASVIWIGVISWFMVEWTQDIGCALGVPSAMMGVTILAAGTSIPDALSSISVAQEGKGDMAVANAIGSNLFNVWIGLGLPWLLVIPFKGKSGLNGTYMEVDNNELLQSIAILFVVLFFYLFFVFCTQWTLNKHEGYAFVALYVVFIIFQIISVWAFDVHDNESIS